MSRACGVVCAALALHACAAPPATAAHATLVPAHPAHRLAQFPRPAEDEMRPPTPRHEVPLVELRDAASPIVTFRVLFESGSADDPAGHEGATHLAARAMAEGGTEALAYEDLVRRLFPLAASITFHVDRDATVFVAQVHRDHVALFYPLFRDVMLHPRFDDSDVQRVRAQTLSDLVAGLRGSDDEALGREMLQAVIYAEHPYGHPALGTERGLAALRAADLRVQRAAVFCRDRARLGLAGGYEPALAAQFRADMGALPSACAPRAALPTVERPHGLHVVVVDKPTASATAISIGYPIAVGRTDPDYAALTFVTDYLGLHRQSSGQLTQAIRETRGLNYGDYAYAEHFAQQDDSRFPQTNIVRRQQYASVWIRPVRPDAAHFALRAALRVVGALLEHGIADEDFVRTRAFLSGYVGLYTQTESARLGAALDDAVLGTPAGTWAERLRDAWSHLDRDAALAVARRDLTAQDLDVVLVAPNARAVADAIARNAPSPVTYDTPHPQAVLDEDRAIAAYALPVRAEDVRVVPLADVFR